MEEGRLGVAVMEWKWVPGAELEEDDMYGGHMPDNMPINPTMFVCSECGGLNRHLRSCSRWKGELEIPDRVDDE